VVLSHLAVSWRGLFGSISDTGGAGACIGVKLLGMQAGKGLRLRFVMAAFAQRGKSGSEIGPPQNRQ
jgi:hypothetical protein